MTVAMVHERRFAGQAVILLTIISFVTAGSAAEYYKRAKHAMTKEQAKEIAVKTIDQLKPGTEFVILDEKTMEKDFGWVFFYAPKKYVETGNPKYLVPGNSPIVVHRSDGSTHFLSTSVPPSRAIEVYEQRWREAQTAKGH